MILKIALCDDEEKEINTLRDYLNNYEFEYNIDFEISPFINSKSLLSQYSHAGAYHIVFLDVEMPRMNGLELAAHIRNIPDRAVKIIFVSNYPEYMQDSFNVHAYHYLSKPLCYENVKKVLSSVIREYQESHITKLLVKEDGMEELIFLDDIITIQTTDSKKKILTVSLENKDLTTRGLIGEWEKELSKNFFCSPCRGYLVNLNHIHFIKEEQLIMSNGSTVPISRRKEKEIRNLFTRNLLSIKRNR